MSCQIVSCDEGIGIHPLFCPFCGEDFGEELNQIQEGEAERYLERIFEPELGMSLDDMDLL
jgi:hypothetical protein